MAQQIINVGTAGDDGTGDTIRRAGIRINDNFTEVYAFDNVASDLSFDGNTIKTKSSNNNIELRPSGTGSVNFPGLNIRQNNIEAYNSNDDIRITPSGTGNLVFPGITFRDNVIEATRSNDDIVLRSAGGGDLSAGVIKLADGILLRGNDIEGVRSNDDINLRTSGTGAITFNDAIRVRQNQIEAIRSNDNLHISPAGSGAIFFGEGIKISGNDITSTRSNENLGIIPAGSGNVVIDGLSFAGTTITATDSSNVNINDGLIVDGNLTSAGASTFDSAVSMESTLGVTGLATLSTLQVSGASSFVGTTTVDNLTFNDNIIGTSSNADLRLTPGGTGVVNVSNITIDAALNLTDNIIKVTRSNDSLLVNASGTGSVVMSKADVDSGNIDDTVIGATTPAAATFSSLTFNPTASGSLATTGVTVTDNTITSNRSNENLELTGNGTGTVTINGFALPSSDGSTGQVLRTDGSKTLSFITSPILLGASDIQDIEGQIGFSATTTIDHVTSTGTHEQIGTDTVILDKFDLTKYRSAFYFLVKRQDDEDEFEASKLSVLHGKSDDSSVEAFITESHVLAHTSVSHVQPTVDIDRGELRLFGSGANPTNSTIFYRIGLGDDDSSGYISQDASQASGVVNADVDSASESVDSFAHGTFRAAKYYFSCIGSDNNEVMNLEAMVVHNGTDAFITTFNELFSGNNPLCTFTAAISGSNVVVSASGLSTNVKISGFRVLLKDNESASTGDRVNIIGQTTISSTATAIDTFSDNSFTAAHYIVCATNSGESAASATEAIVISDGSTAFISQGPMLSTKSSDQVILTADHDGSNTVTLKAQSTSGSSTTVTAYRVALLRGPGSASQDAVIDTYDKTVFRSAKYNVSISDSVNNRFEISEINVTHNGSDAFVSTFGSVTNHTDALVTFTADVSGDNVRLIGTISNTENHTLKAVKRVIQV